MAKLKHEFYQGKTESVAKRLLGQILVHKLNGKRLAGRIVEVEAYLGIKDKACHTFAGKKTDRTKTMYMSCGHAYVYLIYGIHSCLNVVTRDEKHPEAVLIRALEPLEGIEQMQKLRKTEKLPNLCSGPGKLCQAMGIDRSLDGKSLFGSEIYIEEAPKVKKSDIVEDFRIGVDYAEECALWPLRFMLKDSRFVSVKPKRLLLA
jgi:DNA-3-methyladenine glycosylase